jgi:hypothetical protein
MVEPNQAGWMRTLAQVEEAIQGCLTSLDRYEVAFGKTYAEAKELLPAKHYESDPRLDSLEKVWVERLTVAQHAADEVELLLNEQQDLWGKWLDSYNLWKQSLERMPGDPPEASHAENRRDTPRRRKVGAVR